jgi:4-amino-4-deoxy-L-arabinose transferase-like glycosyltransferase
LLLHRRRAVAVVEPAIVFAVLLATLVAASLGFGLTWDESTYFRYADSIRDWWRAGAPADATSLQRYWAYDSYSNPHPPFMREVVALGAPLAEGRLKFPTDYRLGHLAWIAGCLAAAYALLRPRFSALAAAGAVAFVALQPRVFGHLLIAASDSPVAMAWLLLALLAWRLADDDVSSRARTALWVAFFAVAGWAAASKFTGLLALPPLAAFFFWRRRWRDVALVGGAAAWALAFVVVASPQHWHHPLAGVVEYLKYPLSRQAVPFSTAYFGRLYKNDLPWHYFFVMSGITMPLVVLALLPCAVLARGERRQLLAPVAFAAGFWLLLVHLPKTPRHDEVRQFLSIYPLLGIVAWIGLQEVVERARAARPNWLTPPVVAAAGALAIVAVVAPLARAHPHELSDYNALIGGVRGAERAGMEMSLYFEAIDDRVLAELSSAARPGETLAMSPLWPPLLESYAQHGRLDSPLELLPFRSKQRPDWALLVRRRYFIDDRLFRQLPAVYRVEFDGVPLVLLVHNSESRPAAPAPGGER